MVYQTLSAPASRRWPCWLSEATRKGISAYVLDGDSLRHGLNADRLGFPWPTARRTCAGFVTCGHTARRLWLVLVPAMYFEHRALS